MRRPVRTLRAEATVEQRGRRGRIRGTVFTFLARPDRVRFDAMTQFGPASILTSDGDSFSLTDLRENRFLTGPTCPQNIARLIGMPLPADALVRILFGETPEIAATEESIVCSRDGTYRISRRDARGFRQELEFAIRDYDRRAPPEEQRLRLLRAELHNPMGALEWRATYDDYRVVRDPRSDASPKMGVAMPFRVNFEDARNRSEVRVRFRSIDLNVAVPETAFWQSPPPGITPEEVSCD